MVFGPFIFDIIGWHIYLHNSKYGKRLIFVSIDWMDNGVLNGTITIPAEYPEARVWLNANASGVATRP